MSEVNFMSEVQRRIILGEEYGETCEALLENHFGNQALDDYEKEMREVAAVAIAALENLERLRSEPKVYLAGPIAQCSDGETYNWREHAAEGIGIPCLNPATDRDFRDKPIEDEWAQIIQPDKDDIDTCSILLANCWQISVGTTMEILYAWERGKYVVTVIPNGVFKSLWATGHSHYVTGTVEDAIAHINGLAEKDVQEKE